MLSEVYTNKTTGRQVRVIFQTGDHVVIRYEDNGSESFWTIEGFRMTFAIYVDVKILG
jgi:hypothetical protein